MTSLSNLMDQLTMAHRVRVKLYKQKRELEDSLQQVSDHIEALEDEIERRKNDD